MSIAAMRTQGKGRHLWVQVKKHWPYYLVIAPIVIYFFIFKYIPMYGVTIAFKDYTYSRGILNSPWSVPLLKNFDRAFSSILFWRAFRNTLILSVLGLVINFPLTILYALLLDEMPGRKYKRFIQTVSYLPHFISWVVLVGIFRTIFSPTTGVVNAVIEAFGGKSIYFMADAKWFRPMVVITSLWKGIGYGSVIYIAAITGIDQEQYEAAREKLGLDDPIPVRYVKWMGNLLSGDLGYSTFYKKDVKDVLAQPLVNTIFLVISMKHQLHIKD